MTQTVVNVPAVAGGGGQMGEGTFYQEGSVSGDITIDFANGYYQELTLTGDVTSLAFSNGPASGEGKSVVVDFVQGGSGSYTVTFTSTKFDSGIAPTLSTGICSNGTTKGHSSKLSKARIDGGCRVSE
jgi:hypothetical protein